MATGRARLARGAQNSPLPDEVTVLRAHRPRVFDASEKSVTRDLFSFELSTSDKAQKPPRLSVYVFGLTTEEQACALVGDGTTHRLILRLPVARIRALVVGEHRLDAVWDEAVLDDGSPDMRPGAEGHAGITGLVRPPGMDKIRFKRLSVDLADLASEDYIELPLQSPSPTQ